MLKIEQFTAQKLLLYTNNGKWEWYVDFQAIFFHRSNQPGHKSFTQN